MTGSDAAIAQTAKRQVVTRNVDDAVVDGEPTRLDLGQDRFDEPLALAEHIKGERSRAVVDEPNGFVNRSVDVMGKTGPKISSSKIFAFRSCP